MQRTEGWGGLKLPKWLRSIILWTPALAMTACAHKPLRVPDRAPPAVQVLVPIAKPCEVVKVAKSPLVTDGLGAGNDLYEAVKRVLADRAILIGDRERLAAANDEPCGKLTADASRP